MLLFAVVGLVGALGTSVFLWLLGGPEYAPASLPWVLTFFPLLAATWSACFKVRSFGTVHGALVALLTFISFWGLFTVLSLNSVWIFLAWCYFSFISFGWLFVLLGAWAGRHFRITYNAF